MFHKAVIYPILVVSLVLARGFVVKYEKFELVEYEKFIISLPKVSFDPVTQTMNASVYLWQTVNDPVKMMQGSVEFFMKENDNYVPTGYKLKKNLCYMWNQNVDGFKTKIEKYGNVNCCSWNKGDLYVRNYPLDDSFFPKSLKPGQYKITMKAVMFTFSELLSAVAYVQVTPE